MNTALWVVQILLAIIFLLSGVAKLSMSRERLRRLVSYWPSSACCFPASWESPKP